MIAEPEWTQLRRLLASAFSSSLHTAVASVGPDGAPYVTPIGSLLLGDPGHAFYFEIFASGLGRRLGRDQRLSVLVVDSGRLLWLRALVGGRFPRPPAVRLVGRAGERRPPSESELRRWRRRVGLLARLPGGRTLWSRLDAVRELRIERVDPIRLGALTDRPGRRRVVPGGAR